MFFSESALSWDTQRRINRSKLLANSICDRLGNTKELTALEIGCGTGLMSFELSDKFQEIYCVDKSKEMLNIMNEKIIYYDNRNLYTYNVERFNKEKYRFKFDVVYSSMVFHHIVDIEGELKMAYNLMKENGRLAIIDLDNVSKLFHKEEKEFTGYDGFEREKLKIIIEKSGFRDVSFQTVYKDEKMVCNDSVSYSLFLCTAKK